MGEPVVLRYHQATFDLLDEEPVLSAVALAQIERFEQSNRIRLPAAMREWYSLEARTGTITDTARSPLDSLQSLLRAFDFTITIRGSRRMPLAEYLPYATAWVSLEDLTDPPTLPPSWSADDERPFSIFVFELAWNKLTGPHALNVALLHEHGVCGPPQLDCLRDNFKEVPRPYAPPSCDLLTKCRDDCSAFYFYDDTSRICVSARGVPEAQECEASWSISSSSEARLRVILRLFWGLLGNSMELFIPDGRDNDAVERILLRLRQDFGMGAARDALKGNKR